MEPWAADSPAMRDLMGRFLNDEFTVGPTDLPVARTDEDIVVTTMILRLSRNQSRPR